jgi:hypothetical protein
MEGRLLGGRSSGSFTVILIASSAIAVGATAADAPKVAPPRPAPAIPPTVPRLPPAQIDQSLAIGGEELKARQVETRLTVPVHVNGQGPYNFIVDSGADTSVIGLRIARGLQLPLAKPAILNGMTSRDIVDRVQVAELRLGNNRLHNVELPALRETHLGGDGLIGIDALVQQRLLLDFEKQLIQIEDARVPIRIRRGDIVVTARRRRGQLILTQVNAGRLPVEAVIDTGTQITIGNLALRDKLLRGNRDKFVTMPVTGVTGVRVNMQFGKIGQLQLGPVVLYNVPIAFADVPPFKLFGLAEQPALLLGTDLLASFRRVSLDFKARKVRFQLRKCRIQSITISTSPETSTRIASAGTPDVCAR